MSKNKEEDGYDILVSKDNIRIKPKGPRSGGAAVPIVNPDRELVHK